jgi:hypothetical protein
MKKVPWGVSHKLRTMEQLTKEKKHNGTRYVCTQSTKRGVGLLA